MNNYKCNGYKRITKTSALKAWKSGSEVYVMSCKMAINGYWGGPIVIRNVNDEDMVYEIANFTGSPEISFRNWINNFKYYNCDYERGYYPSFYLKA
jgi:hypothetical protein